jgi:transcriptional regulator with XRE-family HTH domain
VAVHALAQLIEEVRHLSDPPLSIRELGRRSRISPSRMHQLVNDQMKAMPDPATLRSLADGLRLPLRVVVDAALTSVGLPSGSQTMGKGTIEQMRTVVESSTILTAEDRGYWIAMIDALDARVRRERHSKRSANEDSLAAALEALSRPTLSLASRQAALEPLRKRVEEHQDLTEDQRKEWMDWIRDWELRLLREQDRGDRDAPGAL